MNPITIDTNGDVHCRECGCTNAHADDCSVGQRLDALPREARIMEAHGRWELSVNGRLAARAKTFDGALIEAAKRGFETVRTGPRGLRAMATSQKSPADALDQQIGAKV